jgi:thiamine transporter
MSIFFQQVVSDGETTYSFTTAGYTLFIVLLLAALLTACFFTNRDNKQKFSTRQLVFSSVAIALAFVTSNIKLLHLPFGGSITLFSMFFICFIGYLYGLRSGLTAGIAYGLLQMLIDPYVVSVPQLLTDYILAFGALGLAGIFANSKYGIIKGYLMGIFGRFVFAVLSGVIFFGMYAPDGMNPLVYSIAYNGLYIGVEGGATLIILAIPAVRSALGRVKVMANEEESKALIKTA